ncbi:MAG: YdiU family protein [Methylococcales bacterium]|nr:MAG: YdiU family protein [Methylococcales bacterium]
MTHSKPSDAAIKNLSWTNPWLQLPDAFYQRIQLTPLDTPYFIHCNTHTAELLGLSAEQLQNEATLHFFNGQQLPPEVQPTASVYAGHQFGIFTAQLGDGRVLSLGEVVGHNDRRYEIQLKGAGLTLYSRTLDGRCPLGSAIREYLGSEALAGLNIPTSRALCLLGSETKVQREYLTTGALLVRMARSHIRFGHFEYFHHKGDFENVKNLTTFVIEQHFPDVLNEPIELRPLRLLEAIVERTACLIAAWQSEGFTHGVINTDNMSVLGDTLDFGPFGFMETYHPEFLANASDDLGRYQFDQQPEIGRWNCLALAEAMSSLLPSRTIPAKLLRLYRQHYHQHYLQRLRLKLGLSTPHPDDAKLIEVLLTTLQQGNIDYALFFRNLADFINVQEKNPALYTLTTDSANLMQWLSLYQDRLRLETISSQERQKQMNQVNPCYVLRSHLLKQSITDAEHGDLTEFYRLLTLLQNPFEEQTGMDFYAQPYNPEAG